MTLTFVVVSIIAAILLGLVARSRWRQPLLLAASALAVYAFQPALAIRGLDFWFPTATLALTVLTWILTTPRELRAWRNNWPAAAELGGIVLVLGLNRYLDFQLPLVPSLPPQTYQIAVVLAGIGLAAFLVSRLTKPGKVALAAAFIFFILVFIVLKLPSLGEAVSAALRSMNKQSTALAAAQDLRWLGFSYIAFRLLHTIRDRQAGRLPNATLSEYLIYVIFFPALSAGPIDRIERFLPDLRIPSAFNATELGEGGKRLALGLFKKFVIADGLALIALNGTNASQVHTAGWSWVLLYAFAFQIYFDFSGYTDIAIGLGRWMGIKLPENFRSPYLKPNLTQFWNNWHMTLTQWFRSYFFNPITRALRSNKKKLPIAVIVFVTQVATMVLIGMWHGIALNFILWGAWHGLGLFAHNRWSELTKAGFSRLSINQQKLLNIGGTLLTFNFVALGWVFFALPEPSLSLHFLQTLFGLA
jgi:alginate O-acetyltransferase complex protein AlgI